MKSHIKSDENDGCICEVPVSAVLKLVRPVRYGSVPGLDDSDLMEAEELERQVTISEWGPVLMLPSLQRRGWIEPVVEDGVVHYGAFSTVDFERTQSPFNKARYKAGQLQEQLRHVLILFDIVNERIPGKAKYLVLKHLKMGIIDLGQIVDDDVSALAKLYVRIRRLRQQMRELTNSSAQTRARGGVV